jgi:hypothetical protein
MRPQKGFRDEKIAAIEGVVGCGLSVGLDPFQLQLKELWVVGYQLGWTYFNCN